MGPRTQPEQVYSTNRDIKTQDAFGLLTIMTYMLSAGIHWLPQMILWVMIHTPFKEHPLASASRSVELFLLVLSAGIHWLPQMVLWLMITHRLKRILSLICRLGRVVYPRRLSLPGKRG